MPTVSSLNSTSLSLSWSPPGRANGIISFYALYAIYPVDELETYSTVLVKRGMFNSYKFDNLRAFSNYSFRVEAGNQAGNSSSEWRNVTTLEDGKM